MFFRERVNDNLNLFFYHQQRQIRIVISSVSILLTPEYIVNCQKYDP